jgi:putative glycosyltransferase (TIGR04372 family)
MPEAQLEWYRLFVPTALGNSVADHVALAKHKQRTGARIGLAYPREIEFQADLIICNPYLDAICPLDELPVDSRQLPDASFGRPWNYLIENTERVRLRLPDDADAVIGPLLEAHGIGGGDPILAIHAREPGFEHRAGASHEPERDVAIGPFVEVARRYLARGFKVIRIGDPSCTPFPALPGLFDAAHHPDKQLIHDLYFVRRACVLLATDSGVWPIGVALGTPTVLSNSCHGQPALGAARHWFPWEPGHRVLSKALYHRGRRLTPGEGIRLFRGQRWRAIEGETRLEDNTADELEAAVEALLREREGGGEIKKELAA